MISKHPIACSRDVFLQWFNRVSYGRDLVHTAPMKILTIISKLFSSAIYCTCTKRREGMLVFLVGNLTLRRPAYVPVHDLSYGWNTFEYIKSCRSLRMGHLPVTEIVRDISPRFSRYVGWKNTVSGFRPTKLVASIQPLLTQKHPRAAQLSNKEVTF